MTLAYNYNNGYVTLNQMNSYSQLLNKRPPDRASLQRILSTSGIERYRWTYSWAYEYNTIGYVRRVPGLMYQISGLNLFNIFQESVLDENYIYNVTAVVSGSSLEDFLSANPNLVSLFPLVPISWVPSNVPGSMMVYVPVSFVMDHSIEYL